MVVNDDSLNGFVGFGVSSKNGVPCFVGVDETSYNGLSECLIKLFNAVGWCFERH